VTQKPKLSQNQNLQGQENGSGGGFGSAFGMTSFYFATSKSTDTAAGYIDASQSARNHN
jgi:hypothetical protein